MQRARTFRVRSSGEKNGPIRCLFFDLGWLVESQKTESDRNGEGSKIRTTYNVVLLTYLFLFSSFVCNPPSHAFLPPLCALLPDKYYTLVYGPKGDTIRAGGIQN